MTEQVFVARERELSQLQTFLDLAQAGQGQVCFVTGEAGAGKTALVTEFARRAQEAHADLVVAIGDCNAQTGIGDPYLPFREVLGLLTGDVEAKLAQGAISQENAGRLRNFLRVSGQALVDLGPDLIDIFVPGVGLATRAGAFLAGKVGWLERLEELTERRAAPAGGPGLEQSRIFEQYTDVLNALAGQRPLMLVVDNLHWADVSSISLLFHLGRRIGESRILIAGAYRPEDVALGRASERHPLESVVNELKRYYGDVWVDPGRAARAEGRGFVDAFLDTEPNRLGEEFRQALFQRTEGHPLFTIELLRNLQEWGNLLQDEEGRWVERPTLEWDTLPARVEGVIEERIGRLEAELREAVTVASVEGEDFTAEVVARVQAVDERGLVRQLSGELDKQHRLVGARGIRRLGRQRLSLYRFRHNLFQKYLYNSLDEVERSYLHEDVGTVLEELYGDQAEEIAAIAPQLARHFQEAGITEKAIDYLHQAGNRAVRLSANEEAIAHLTKGLELLKTLPEAPERAQQELGLQVALGAPLMATKGPAAPEVEQAYARARELCRQVGETPQLFPVLRGLWEFYHVGAELQTARELGEQLVSLAQRVGDTALLLEAHFALGFTLWFLGELAPAREHVEQVIALYDTQQHHSLAFLYGTDPGVFCRGGAAYILWLLGYPDQALERSHDALALAQELAHPFSLAIALFYAADLHQYRREGQRTQERAEAAIALCTEQGFPFWLAAGTGLHGWSLAEQGQGEEGIAQIRQGLTAYRATGARLVQPWFLAMLAETCGKVGQTEEGLTVLTEALAVAEKTGERWYEAELHRLKGELLLMQGESEAESFDSAQDEAEACFRQAIKVARRQSATSWELRATVSLCRLWQSQGKGEEARQLLAEIYGWFTEGFDTADLKEARALLDELS